MLSPEDIKTRSGDKNVSDMAIFNTDSELAVAYFLVITQVLVFLVLANVHVIGIMVKRTNIENQLMVFLHKTRVFILVRIIFQQVMSTQKVLHVMILFSEMVSKRVS